MPRRLGVLLAAALLAALTLAPSVTAPAQAATPITVSGVVRDDAEQPVAGAKVEALTTYCRECDEIYGTTTTDDSGHYSMTFDPVHVVDGEQLWAEAILVTPPTTRHWAGGLPLPSYAPGDHITLDVEIAVRATISGTVTDGSGAPVADAEVRLHNVTDEQDDGNCDFGCSHRGLWWDDILRTDADGHFSRWVNDRDLVGVVVEADGYQSRVLYDVLPESDVAIVLSAGQRGFPPSTVTGVLVDEAGNPLAHQPIVLSGWERGGGDEVLSTAETGDDGGFAFSFDPLALPIWAGAVSVGNPPEAGSVLSRGPSGYYEPGSSEDLVAHAGALGTISGVITDDEGAPLPDVTVEVQFGPDTTTDADGRYTLTTVPGWITLVYRAEGFWSGYPSTVLLAPGEMKDRGVLVLHRLGAPGTPQGTTAGPKGPRRAWVRIRTVDHGDARIDALLARCRGKGVPERSRQVDVDGAHSVVVVTGLRPDHRYRCQIRVHNRFGWSLYWSERSRPFRTPGVGR